VVKLLIKAVVELLVFSLFLQILYLYLTYKHFTNILKLKKISLSFATAGLNVRVIWLSS